jgi:hypothetical protein
MTEGVTMSGHSERITIVRSQIESLDTICHGIVVHQGEQGPCCKPATAIVYDAEGADVWPACTWHAHRYGGALTLSQVREALTTGATHIEREVADY